MGPQVVAYEVTTFAHRVNLMCLRIDLIGRSLSAAILAG